MDDASVGQDDVERRDRGRGGPVGDAPESACVGRDVAAHRGQVDARRVRGEEQAVLPGALVQVGGDDSGLDVGQSVRHVDVQHAIHRLQGHHESAGIGHRAAGQSRTAAPDRHRGLRLVRPSQGNRDVVGGFREDHPEGLALGHGQ
jgi:hypothetical protein